MWIVILKTWKDVSTLRISDDDETLINVENVDSKETHPNLLQVNDVKLTLKQ